MSLSSTPTRFITPIKCLLLVGGLFLFCGHLLKSVAQPVHPRIQLKQPSPLSSNTLDHLQHSEAPAIGLYFSMGAFRSDVDQKARLAKSIQQWEYLLIGLQLPYVLISDSLFNESITDFLDVLVVPAPEALSDSSLQIVKKFVEEGGGLIASGYSGPPKKNREADSHLKELVGIKELVPMGMRSGKIKQKLKGGHLIGRNLPIGFEMDLLSNQTAYVAYMDHGTAIGPAIVSGELQPFTCMATNTYGEGRVVWMGFSPQDIPPSDEQQRGYQELVLDAFVFVSGSAYTSVRRWPLGYQSASSFIQLPSSGYQPFSYRTSTDLLLRAFDKHNLEATYFVVLQHAQDHPDLLVRMAENGELGLVSDSPKPLSGLAEDLQYERLSVSKWLLESEYEQLLIGALPPGYFYDANTLRVLSELGVQYVLSDARHYQEPVFIDWHTELDYRDSLVVGGEVDSLGQQLAAKTPPPLVRMYPTLFSYDLDAPLAEEEKKLLGNASIQERWTYRLKNGFDEVHGAGGLFAFGFEPETMGLSEQRVQVLESFVASLFGRNTWRVSLSEVLDWWEKRDSITVFLEEVAPERAALKIANKGNETLRGVSLDVYLPDFNIQEANLKADGLQVSITEQSGNLYLLQIHSLATGTHTIDWEMSSNKTTDESD